MLHQCSFVVLVTILFEMVDARQCTYIFGKDTMKIFSCDYYEYCCGPNCCHAQVMTFYQVWYFWLIVFLTLLLCSGGSWWYRFRVQRGFIDPQITAASMTTAANRPHAHHPGMAYGSGLYMATHSAYPQQPMAQPPPPFRATNQQPQSQQLPPYYEAPPSYDAAVKQAKQDNGQMHNR